jgi:predicted ATPase
MIGKTINDRYQLDAEIGEGGMGTVYRAHDLMLERDVAIKLMSNTKLGTEGRARLLHEAQATAKLNHPNIVTVHDAGEIEDSPYIVMELIEGQTLHEIPPIELEEIIPIMKQVCKALEHAHAHDIIHRDLKPENVIIDVDGTAKLMDFGLARSVASRLTSEGTLIGTVFYMAPEQAMNKNVDARTDLYSLGVMLYELTTGRLPFTDDSPVAVISQHLYAPVVPPTSHKSSIPTELEALILRLLAKSPQDRYSSASEILKALDGILAILAGSPDLQTVTSSEPRELTGSIALLDRMVRGRLIGRQSELIELRNLWDRSADGQGHMVLISGKPGIGKTRLSKELMVYAQLRGALVLEGRFHPELGVPYLGFWEALRDYLRSQPPDAAREEIGTTAPELIKLVPEIREIMGDIEPNPPMGDVETERLRLFDHITQFLLGISSKQPILFLLDDLHWADKPSLLFLHFILRNVAKAPILIVGTYRETELDPVRPFYETLVGLNRERLFTRMALRQLSSDRIKELIQSLLDCSVDDKLIEAIDQETDGNPFFVEEVVRSLLEKDTLKIEDGCYVPVAGIEVEVPQSIQVALGRRLSGLSKDCQLALTQAAVLGREFNFDVLHAMGEWEEDALLDVLDEAVRAQLIAENRKTGETNYQFLHALLVQVLYESINRRRQTRFHQTAGEALERVHSDNLYEHVEALAHHFSLSRADVAEKALDYNLQAAEKAVTVYAHDQAVRYYTMALEVLQDIEDPEREAQIWELLGDTHLTSFVVEEAISAYENAQAVLKKGGLAEDDQYCKLSCKLGQVIAREGNDPERARNYLESALAHIPTDPENLERIKCMAALATCLVQEEAVPQAVEQAQMALELAEDTGKAVGIASACEALCQVHQAQGDVAAFIETAERQVTALDESGDLYGQFEAYANIISANWILGHYDVAEQWTKAAIKLSQKFNAPGWESTIMAHYMFILKFQGRWAEALSHGDRILPLFQRVGCSNCFCYIFAALGEIEARLGNPEKTREYIQNSIDIFKQIDTPFSAIAEIRWKFFGQFYLEEWEQAWTLVEEMGRREYPMLGSLGSASMMASMVPQVAARVGLWDEAATFAKDALAIAQRPRLPNILATSHFALGLVHAGQEQWDEAIDEFREALTRYNDLGHRWDIADTQYELGLVYSVRSQAGDNEEARKLFEDALVTLNALETEPAISKVNEALGKL